MSTITAYQVAAAFLEALDAPVSDDLTRAAAIWLAQENAVVYGGNPWNLHSGSYCPAGYCPGVGSLPGQIGNRYAGSGDQNVAVFATLADGIRANAANLVSLAGSGYGYDVVIAKARAGDALGFLTALQDSSWSAGHYDHHLLVDDFNSGASYDRPLTFVNFGTGITGDLNVAYTYAVLQNPDGTYQRGGFARVDPNGQGAAFWDLYTGAKLGQIDATDGDKPSLAHVRRSDGHTGSLTVGGMAFVDDGEAPWQPDPAPSLPAPDCTSAVTAEYTRVTKGTRWALTFPPAP